MSKNCTDINQSCTLLALGLNPNTADYMYIGNDGPYPRLDAKDASVITPAWSMAALLDLLPSGTLFLSKYMRVRADFRGSCKTHDISLSPNAADTYLDAVYEMVTIALKEKYI